MRKNTTFTLGKSIDLGVLQATFANDTRALRGAEKKLKQAQDARDAAKARAEASEQALRDGTRTVLG